MQDTTAVLELIAGICQQQKIQFFPESATEAEWNEFIASAKRACSTGVNHPVKGAFWRSCQAALPDLAAQVADPERRAAIATAARTRSAAVRSEALEHLSDALDLLCGQGGSITPEERQMLLDEYIVPTGGLLTVHDLNALLDRCNVRVGAAVSVTAVELLPQAEMARLKSELQVFDTDSLFAFLGVRMDAPLATVSARIDSLKHEWSTKKADHKKTAANACLSSAQKYLGTAEMKRRYEVSWAHGRLAENKFIGKVMIAGRDGVIDSAECDRLLTTAAGLGVSRELALDVMRVVATAEGFKINEPSKAPVVTQPVQPVQPQPPQPGNSTGPQTNPGPVWPAPVDPRPFVDPDNSMNLQANHRTSAAICYVFPLMSLYVLSTRSADMSGDKGGLYFAAYQSLGLAGVSMAAMTLSGGWLTVPCLIAMGVLAYQAYNGVQMQVPVIGEWAMKKAA